jgi:hypothetical protein
MVLGTTAGIIGGICAVVAISIIWIALPFAVLRKLR